jgi:serine/threonine protein phosphatase 1
LSDILENRRGFVVGDIHGCARALRVLVQEMDLTSDDFVVVLGDAIDRGPDSRKVLDRLLDIDDACELIFVLGNHEEMMLDAMRGRNLDEWLRHGGNATMASYGGSFNNIPEDHLDLLETAVRYWEGPTEICVHANLEPGVELKRQRSSWLRWKKLIGLEYPHESGKRVICGHSGVSYAAPSVKNGWICLDTMAYGGGVLSALDLATGEILQARQNGESRRGVFLSELEA